MSQSAQAISAVPQRGLPRIVIPWSRLLPLWRHAVWLAALAVVVAVAVTVRIDVSRLQVDLDRHDRLQREATQLNDRLRLELDARRRLVALQGLAGELRTEPIAKVVRVSRTP